jgi:hypothetical protein
MLFYVRSRFVPCDMCNHELYSLSVPQQFTRGLVKAHFTHLLNFALQSCQPPIHTSQHPIRFSFSL